MSGQRSATWRSAWKASPSTLAVGLIAVVALAAPMLPRSHLPTPSLSGDPARPATRSFVDTRIADAVRAERERLPINFRDYGPDRTGGSPVDALFARFVADCMAQHRRCYVPSGRYRFAAQLSIDLAPVAGRGFSLVGEGDQQTIFDVTLAPNSAPQAAIFLSGGVPGTPATGFYFEFARFGIVGNTPGTMMQVGKRDFTDDFNGVSMERIHLANTNAAGGATAATLELNNGFNNWYRHMTVNGGGSRSRGVALRVRQTTFSKIHGSFGNAETGIEFADGYNYANTIDTADIEEVAVCVRIRNAQTARNIFLTGQYVFGPSTTGGLATGAFRAEAGDDNMVVNANVSPSHGAALARFSDGLGVGLTFVTPTGVETAAGSVARHQVRAGRSVAEMAIAADGTAYLSNHTPGKSLALASPAGVAIHNGLTLASVPTSPAGLAAGAVWRDAANGNVLKVVP